MTPSLLLAAWIAGASASPVYTTTLRDTLGMPCAPTCLACHTTAAGGGGTVQQPFGEALMNVGLAGGGDTASLTTALDALGAHDSDGDGNPDLDELANGENPNGGDPFCAADGADGPDAGDGTRAEVPSYGCLNTSASGTGLLGLALAAAALVGRRRRTATRGT